MLRNEVDNQKLTEFLEFIYAILDIVTAFFEGKQRAEAMFQPGITIVEVQRVFDDDQLDVLEFTEEQSVIVI